jgi:tetratricopeptide (TPR) repeat protein
MKSRSFFIAGFAILLMAAGSRYANHIYQKASQASRFSFFKHKQPIQCSPDWSYLNEDSMATHMGVLPGWGNYQWAIRSTNDSAKFYFTQGINMYYAFHIIEAMASFKKAATFDDNNAMLYWAQALAYGPNINDIEYAATPEAFTAAQKALALKGGCTAKEQALIEAMAVRYSTDSSTGRAILNQRYADAMKKAYAKFKQDADIAALYADALMLQHPWDYWKHNGEAEPWTPEILTVLQNNLAIHPNHPGANHYYIHSVEASKAPQRALASANRLGNMMPGVAHMVHMPSHIYIRSGYYKEGITVNEKSVAGYNKYLALYPEVQNNAPLYLFHNLHMQAACAMMRGNYAYSNKTAIDCSNSFDTSFLSLPAPLGNFIQYVYMVPAFNNVRFGKWDAILNAVPVQQHHLYANLIWHWARGMAFAGKNNTAKAREELKIVEDAMQAPDLKVVMPPFNAPIDAAKVATKILAGVIAEQENDLDKAVSLLSEAAVNEDAMIYDEPKDWLLPAREYLGNALLRSGNAAQAEKVFKEDLQENPNNHWSLYGLYQSLLKQKKNAAAVIVKKQFDKAFEGSDIKAGSIIF